ncbi:hypothetical protein PABG_12027 [Paracoccidioides brasiliensis Pb03]|nr:hypothetical protein PABG_12027 [Paracoccidioides brasiliensis Pb03]
MDNLFRRPGNQLSQGFGSLYEEAFIQNPSSSHKTTEANRQFGPVNSDQVVGIIGNLRNALLASRGFLLVLYTESNYPWTCPVAKASRAYD